jgi:hypothetical protein
VAIVTGASNGCWQFPAPLLIRITPHDRENIGSDVCPQNAPTFQRVVPITALAAGKLKIEVLMRLSTVSARTRSL